MIYLLHISDLHLVADPQWNNMKNAILESVRETLREVPLGEKLLVITGDFHNFIQDNFVYAEEFVLSLVKAMGIDLEKDVFVIPGNHDVSNNIPGEVDREALLDFIKRNPEKLYQNNRIDKLLECYKGYEEFVKKIEIYKETDDRKPVTTHVRTWRGKLNLLHLNTALVADGSEKTGQMADTLTATSQEIRDELRRGNLPCIAIGHNSFYDLEENQRNELAGMFLQEGICAYLSGDRHQKNRKREEKSIVLGEEKGTVTIPNVVGYRTSADKSDTYSDFGMIWHLWDEQAGTVRMKYMRWDPDDQGKMHEDGEGDLYKLKSDPREQAGKKEAADSGERSLYGNGSCWMTKEALSEWNDKAVKQNEIRNFLLGKRCSWKLAFSENLIVERDIVNDLYQKACEGGVYVLLGPGGEGKTTALMQMCAKLFREGANVFYYRGHGLSELSGNIPDHSVFILDNPPERPVFKKVLDKAIEEGITLIIGSRENEWNLLKQSLHISVRDIQEVRMPKLCAKEAWGFADCVCNNLKHMKERKEIKDIFLTNSYGFLYAAMLLAVNKAESLEEIAHQIIENLSHMSHSGMLLLAHIVLAEKCGAKLTKENFRKVCGKLGMSPQEGSRALSREIGLNGENYQTRHEVISNLFYRELFSDGGRLSQEETDKILTELLGLKFGQYDRTYGLLKKLALKEITGLCKGLSLTSLETCQYLVDRVLDEIKTQPKETYGKLFSAVKQDERTQLILFRQCFDRRWLLTQYLKIWCDLLRKKGASWDVTEEYSPAWILRKACIEKDGVSDTWMLWAKMEEKERGAGEYSKENTARWIYRKACEEKGADSSVWLAWAQLEERERGAGEYSEENTARWIYRKACLEKKTDSTVCLAWSQLEEKERGAGKYSEENTALWIYRKACLEKETDSTVWLAWSQLEEKERGAGEYSEENTALWIYRKACLEKETDSAVWLAWAQLEEKERGAGKYSEENTALWIYRKACLEKGADSAVWLAWAQLEEKKRGAGEYSEENTALWIYRNACLEKGADSAVWVAWAKLEEQKANIGEYDQEYTARWILNEGIKRFPNFGSFYSVIADLELRRQMPGRAREILRKGAEYNDFSIGKLAVLELYYGNIDTDSEYCTNKLMAKMKLKKELSFGALQGLYYCSHLLGKEEDAESYYEQLRSHPNFDPDNTAMEEFIHLCQKALQKDSTESMEYSSNSAPDY